MKIQNVLKIVVSLLILLLIAQREFIFEHDFSTKVEKQVQVLDCEEEQSNCTHSYCTYKYKVFGDNEYSFLTTKKAPFVDGKIEYYIDDLSALGVDSIIYISSVEHAFQNWSDSTGYIFTRSYQYQYFTDPIDERAYFHVMTAGCHTFSKQEVLGEGYTPESNIIPGAIILNPCHDWNAQQIIETIAHEAGHCMALGHSTDPNAIMYYVNDPNKIQKIGTDDVEGFFALYERRYKKSYWEHKPYTNIEEFTKYWAKTALKYETVHNKPAELILAKLWHETHGFQKGAGRRGAGFGIKGKGHKGYDKTDQEKVEYQAYDERWEAFSHFCKLIDRPLYKNRYKRWRKIRPQDELYASWAAALQVDIQLKKSKLAYAANGCKDGRDKNCYLRRRNSAKKVINICERIKPILDEYRIKTVAFNQ